MSNKLRNLQKIYTRNINNYVDIKFNNVTNKKISGNYDPINRIKGLSRGKLLRNNISKCKNANEILNIITNNEINDKSVYGFAMKKCNMMKAFNRTKQIMDIAIKKNKDMLDLIQFAIFFDGMANSGSYENYCKKYFDIMINDLNIEPDNIVFGTLFKACRNIPSLSIKWADILFDLMVNKYKLNPSKQIYTELILLYGMNNNIKKMDKLFSDFLISDYFNHLPTWGAYLNVYATQGNMVQVNEIIKIMKQRNIELKIEQYSIVMKCMLQKNCYGKVINLYENMLKLGIKPDGLLIFMVYLTYLKMQTISQNENKERYHYKIMNEMNTDFIKYNIKWNYKLKSIQLNSMIDYYLNKNRMKFVEYFELNKEYFPYCESNNSNQYCIDLHYYSIDISRFIIRYIFAFKFNELINKNIIIICGWGKHNLSGKSDLKDFIINEINYWNYKIQINIDKGRILINSNQLNNCNYVINFFNDISIKWK